MGHFLVLKVWRVYLIFFSRKTNYISQKYDSLATKSKAHIASSVGKSGSVFFLSILNWTKINVCKLETNMDARNYMVTHCPPKSVSSVDKTKSSLVSCSTPIYSQVNLPIVIFHGIYSLQIKKKTKASKIHAKYILHCIQAPVIDITQTHVVIYGLTKMNLHY